MKKGLTIGKTRSALYKSAKFLGDVNSVQRGSVGQRVTNRVVGNVSGKVSNSISRNLMKLFK